MEVTEEPGALQAGLPRDTESERTVREQSVSLAFLAPQIVESIRADTQPAELPADALVKRIEIPLSRSEQVTQLQPCGELEG